MIHDILIVISLGAIGSKLFGWQMDSLYLTALLTVIGFSTQDKIVVFDRIRENSPSCAGYRLRRSSTIPSSNRCRGPSIPN
jgi:preprotein translocase subunit SecF